MSKRLMPALMAFALLSGGNAASAPAPAQQTRSAPQTRLTYAQAQCGGAPRGWEKHGPKSAPLVTYNRISVGPRGIAWNGAAIDAPTLGAYLRLIVHMRPRPATLLLPAPDADCAAVEAVRRILDESAQCRAAGARCIEQGGRDGVITPAPLPPAPPRKPPR